MTKKNIEDMFDDPTPNSYPEMMDEVFEMYLEDRLTPADLKGAGARDYAVWLKKRESAATKVKDDSEK